MFGDIGHGGIVLAFGKKQSLIHWFLKEFFFVWEKRSWFEQKVDLWVRFPLDIWYCWWDFSRFTVGRFIMSSYRFLLISLGAVMWMKLLILLNLIWSMGQDFRCRMGRSVLELIIAALTHTEWTPNGTSQLTNSNSSTPTRWNSQ